MGRLHKSYLCGHERRALPLPQSRVRGGYGGGASHIQHSGSLMGQMLAALPMQETPQYRGRGA